MRGHEERDAPEGYSSLPEDQAEILRRPGRMLEALEMPEVAVAEVGCVYQPIVELATRTVVGYEALTRGPGGSPLESPLALFERMRAAGQEAAFDRACRDAALVRAAQRGAGPPLTIFVNVEPGLLTERPGAEDQTWVHAPSDLRCVIELTERDLARRPAELLHATAAVRELNWGIALDDVGADPTSLALMALLRPDVIKLDLGLVQQQPDDALMTTIAAVNAQALDTGAVVVAEGIETEAHLRTALAFGAGLGQGHLFGRPGPLPPELPGACEPVRFLGRDLHAAGPTPFELVRQDHLTRRVDGGFLHAVHEHLLTFAEIAGAAGVVLATTTDDQQLAARLSELEPRMALLGVVDADAFAARAGLRVPEWSLVVLSPGYAAAAVAQQAGGGDQPDPQYEFALTYDRSTVAACARALAARLPFAV